MLRQQQQQLQFGQNSPNNIPPVSVLQKGEFIVVNDIKDVENYPAPIDGTPVLIFVNGKNVFYNKKFENGNTKCQPNIHQPYNNGEPEKREMENTTETKDNEIMKVLVDITQRLEKLETKKTKQPTTKKVEVADDGI